MPQIKIHYIEIFLSNIVIYIILQIAWLSNSDFGSIHNLLKYLNVSFSKNMVFLNPLCAANFKNVKLFFRYGDFFYQCYIPQKI